VYDSNYLVNKYWAKKAMNSSFDAGRPKERMVERNKRWEVGVVGEMLALQSVWNSAYFRIIW
jgi:hypothetical protein